MRVLAFLIWLVIATPSISADSPIVAVKSYLSNHALANKGLIDKKAIWDNIDDSALSQKYGNRWLEMKPKISFNGFNHDSYTILRAEGNFVIVSVNYSGSKGIKTPRYLLFLVRKDGRGQYRVVPGSDISEHGYINPYLIYLQGLVTQDTVGGPVRDYLANFCSSIQSGETSTPRSEVVSRFLKAYQEKQSRSVQWGYFDVSDLKKTMGHAAANEIETKGSFDGYEYDTFQIEKEFGDFVIASALSSKWFDQSPVHLLFHVRKAKDGSYKIIPGRLPESDHDIDPYVISVSRQNSGQSVDEYFSNLGLYCAAVK